MIESLGAIGEKAVEHAGKEVGKQDLKERYEIDPDKRAEISSKSEMKSNDFDPDSKAEVSEKKKGGSYGELKEEGHGWNSDPPEEVHHMPSAEASPLERNDGPAIVMEREDHRETASCGYRKANSKKPCKWISKTFVISSEISTMKASNKRKNITKA